MMSDSVRSLLCSTSTEMSSPESGVCVILEKREAQGMDDAGKDIEKEETEVILAASCRCRIEQGPHRMTCH